jgi:hypothetical protein
VAEDMANGSLAAGATVAVTDGTEKDRTFRCNSKHGSDIVGRHDLVFEREYATAADVTTVITKTLIDSLDVDAIGSFCVPVSVRLIRTGQRSMRYVLAAPVDVVCIGSGQVH